MEKNDFIVEVNRDNLIFNYNYLRESQKKEIIAVVKANAYGHDITKVVPILKEAGCEYFAVARERETKKILDLKIPGIRILVLESVNDLELLKKEKNVEMTVIGLDVLKRCLEENIPTEQLHLKLDFGFARNGITLDKLEELESIIKEKNLKFKGIMTHLFSADKEDMLKIEEEFFKIVERLGRERFQVIHTQNSAGVLTIKGKGCTHIRCGTILLGLQEIGYFDPNIKRVFRLKGKVAGIKELKNLKYIGYEKKEDLDLGVFEKVAKIRIGYGDGLSKRSENIMSTINNKEYKIIHISMDTSFILVDDDVKVGDEVEIFRDLEKSMKHLKVPHYEFLSCINDRIERKVK